MPKIKQNTLKEKRIKIAKTEPKLKLKIKVNQRKLLFKVIALADMSEVSNDMGKALEPE